MNWKQYEKEIGDLFKADYPEADIRFDVEVFGRYSKTNRQVDVLIEDYLAGNKMRIVVDGKYFAKNVDVKDVESFIAMLADIEAHKGLMITQKGYSKAALNRAYNDSLDIELDILNFEELKRYQGFLGIPFAGSSGVFLPSPFGWIIDSRTCDLWLALLYQRGLDLSEAQEKHEWMYINFWDRKKSGQSLDDLIKIHEDEFKEFFPKAEISYRETIKRKDARTLIRVVEIESYPTPEITGFVEFESFIFFCVLFTPEEVAKKNIRKLENILSKVIPIQVRYPNREGDSS